ncbi:uncharacterized protein MELLADRAFT_103773 [Melampsora larici-populina 98AG31]|uniref:Uncharacterized protein n=1 Tax=Melampsora larici-populina (strain 98AG31 / pathotype 3-4-7) TaxID=747676 RepID=F4RCE5_MELLP|nr:uncharacterized protein MELLADRAFT_103773 [Melampsora larici-populina 98AG31]EGG09716.1 hypothetical protein MELLADRAFT_103773 [Melampsora larici-populina 98AG31]
MIQWIQDLSPKTQPSLVIKEPHEAGLMQAQLKRYLLQGIEKIFQCVKLLKEMKDEVPHLFSHQAGQHFQEMFEILMTERLVGEPALDPKINATEELVTLDAEKGKELIKPLTSFQNTKIHELKDVLHKLIYLGLEDNQYRKQLYVSFLEYAEKYLLISQWPDQLSSDIAALGRRVANLPVEWYWLSTWGAILLSEHYKMLLNSALLLYLNAYDSYAHL